MGGSTTADDCPFLVTPDGCKPEPNIAWLLYTDISATLVVLLLIVFRLVERSFSPGISFNKLTRAPFYCLICSLSLATLQYSFAAASYSLHDAAMFVSFNKTFFLYTAIAIQTFEWYNCLEIIKFQKDYDVTNVHIEKRKFIPIERRITWVFYGLLGLYFAVTNAENIFFLVVQDDSNSDTEQMQERKAEFVKLISNTTACVINFVFFLIMIAQFPATANQNMYATWQDYRKSYWTQVGGTSSLFFTNFLMNGWLWIDFSRHMHKEEKHDHSWIYEWPGLAIALVQDFCIAIFIWYK